MPYNEPHHKTFVALLKLSGLPQSMAEPIGYHLAYLDNTSQDSLIAVISEDLQKQQKLRQIQAP